jgi:myosin heavy subunit
MKVIGISDENQNNLLRFLSAILWLGKNILKLGNIKFVEKDGKVQPSDNEPLKIAAELLEIEPDTLLRSFLFRIINTGTAKRGSTYNVYYYC